MGLFDSIGGAIGGSSKAYANIYTLGMFGGGNNPDFGYKGVDINGKPAQGVLNYQSGMNDLINGLQAPKDIEGYSAKDMSKESLPEFDQARNLTSQSLNSQKQGSEDAMQRRFAAMGNLNSGSYIKAAQVGDQQANEARGNAMAGIGVQEAQTRRNLQQQESQKEFQSGENAKTFNAGQRNQFQQFKTGLSADSYGKISQLDLAYKQLQQQQADDAYQARMNEYQAKHSGGLLGAGGILGTGIG